MVAKWIKTTPYPVGNNVLKQLHKDIVLENLCNSGVWHNSLLAIYDNGKSNVPKTRYMGSLSSCMPLTARCMLPSTPRSAIPGANIEIAVKPHRHHKLQTIAAQVNTWKAKETKKCALSSTPLLSAPNAKPAKRADWVPMFSKFLVK